MKVYIPNSSKQKLGGGFTFLRNIKKSIKDVVWVDSWHDCDIVFIVGATMTDRNEMIEAQKAGKKIVLRIDNLPKDSRNRGTAFSRMRDFAKMADYIIFQSEWAKDYVGWWLREKCEAKAMSTFHKTSAMGTSESKDHGGYFMNSIIYNGIDPEFFFERDDGSREENRYLHVRYNRDETKHLPEACYFFHQAYRKNPKASLWLIGQFGDKLKDYNFDFFADEEVNYWGTIEDPSQMGEMMRSCKYLIHPAFCDASPNVVMEALACGCEILHVNEIGGTKELLELKGRTIYQMGNEYKEVFEKILL